MDAALNNLDKNKHIINNTKSFKIDEKKTTLTTSLVQKNTAVVAGIFFARTAGQYQLKVHLTFNESKNPLILTLPIQIFQVTVQGENTKILPKKININTDYSIVYTFTNPAKNTLTATQIKLIVSDLTEVEVVQKNVDGTGKEEKIPFNELNGTGVLSAGKVFIVSGKFIAKRLGKIKGPEIIFQYDEGEDIVFANNGLISEVVGKKSFPGVLLLTDESHSLIGRLSSSHSLKNGPTFNVGYGRFAWNPNTTDLVCLGEYGKGIVLNQETGIWSSPFYLEGRNRIFRVKWNEDKQHFIAVGRQGGIYLSEDGKQWEKQKVPATTNLVDISWSVALKTYVAVGDNETLITSPDGEMWEIQKCEFKRDIQAAPLDLCCVESSDGPDNQFLVLHHVGNGNEKGGVITSSNGLDWQYHSEVLPSGPNWVSIAWGPSNKKFVVVGDNRSIISSNNGLKWSGSQLRKQGFFRINFHFNQVIYSKSIGAFVAIGEDFSAYYSYSGDTDKATIREAWLRLPITNTSGWLTYSQTLISVTECNFYP